MKYCEFCKKPISENEPCSCPQAQEKVKSDKKKLRKYLCIGIAIVAVIAIVAIIISMASGGPAATQLDPFEYVEANFSSYNTKGKVDVSFAEDRLIEAIIGPEPESIKGYEEWSSKYDLYAQGLVLDYSPRENLSNGDKVTISISATGAAADKIQSGKKTYTVSGLTEIQMVDFFKNLIVTYEGVNGGAKAVLTCQTEDEALNACDFYASPIYNLSSGDSITVTISNVDYLAENYNCIPAETERTYTVPVLAEYVQSADQLPLDTIKALAEKLAADWQREDIDLLTYSETTYYGTYFCFPHTDGIMVEENLLLIFVVYDEYYMGELRRRIYQSFHFPNVVQAADGTVTLDYESGFAGDFNTEIEDHIEQLRNYYDVTEVEINYYDGELVPDSTLPGTPTEPESTDPAPSDPTPTTPTQQTPTTPEEEPSHPPTEETQPPPETTIKEEPHTHTFGSYQINSFKAPTENQPGEIYRFCDCGYKDVQVIPSLNYNVTDPVTGEHICALYTISVPATCVKQAHQLTLCTGCEYKSEYSGSYSNALANHTYSEWTVTKEATATEQGERMRTCSVCGEVNTEVIPATGEERSSYIDPRMEIDHNNSGATMYSYDPLLLGVIDTRTWGSKPSIYIVDESYLSVTYYKQSGEKVQLVVIQISGRYNNLVINDDGSHHFFSVGDFSADSNGE